MEWIIKSMSSRCAVSGEPFRKGDSVICLIFRENEGKVSRFDVLDRNFGGFSFPGKLLGQWEKEISFQKNDDSDTRQLLADREDFFFSLFEGDSDEKKDILKQIFALLLERKRILRFSRKISENFVKYVHVRTRREFLIPDKELKPEDLTFVDNVLEMFSQV